MKDRQASHSEPGSFAEASQDMGGGGTCMAAFGEGSGSGPGVVTTAPSFLPMWSSAAWLQQQQLHSCQKEMCDVGTGGKTIWAAGASVFKL